jgi:hypothetical protein
VTRYLLEFAAGVLVTGALIVALGFDEPIRIAYLSGGLIIGAIVAGREGYRAGHVAERERVARTRARRAEHREQATQAARRP